MAVALTPGQQPAVAEDKPRAIVAPVAFGDKVFRGVLRSAGLAVFLITGLILVFLIFRATTALRAMGFGFFTTSTWSSAPTSSASRRSSRWASWLRSSRW
jgi:phosphate transport system permease protein